MSSPVLTLVSQDLKLAYRRRDEMATPLMFFILVTMLFVLGLSPQPELLRSIAPGVVWVAALLAALIGQQGLFKTDFDDGSLEQWLLAPVPLELLALGRVTSHWLASGLPLVVLSPLLGILMDYPGPAMAELAFSLLFGTAALSLLGAVGAALTMSLRQNGMLLPILVLPLAVPVLIFGAQAATQAAQGEDPSAALYLLAAILVLGITLVPFAIAAAIRVSLES